MTDSETRDPVIVYATAGQALGIPNPICHAMDPSRLLACSLAPGHEPPHNSRADRSGVEWATSTGEADHATD